MVLNIAAVYSVKFILPRTHGGVSHPKIKVSAGTFSSPYARGCFYTFYGKVIDINIVGYGESCNISLIFQQTDSVSEFGVVALAEVVFEYAPQTVEQTDMGKFGNDEVVN